MSPRPTPPACAPSLRGVLLFASLALLVALAAACGGAGGGPDAEKEQEAAGAQGPPFAIAIHGGAGAMPSAMSEEELDAARASLAEALTLGMHILDAGGSALDAVEQAVRLLEDDPRFNAGRGAVFTADGRHTLDAAIMDGSTLAAGAVANVTRARHPITLARRVMTLSPHVLLAGEGADEFAVEVEVELVENSWFSTERRRESLRRAQEREAEAAREAGESGTVGAVALDRQGRLAAATSTGGRTNKRYGRVGDVPIIGAGTYADARVALSATGKGEEFIRHVAAKSVAALVELEGLTLEEAVRVVLEERLAPGDGGFIAVSASGELVTAFTTPAMYRGRADGLGLFSVGIGPDDEAGAPAAGARNDEGVDEPTGADAAPAD